MKSKLTFLAVITAALVIFGAVNQAQASGTRCYSMTIYDAPQYVFAESNMWNMNPAAIAYFPSLLSVAWDVANYTDGLGLMLLQLTKQDSLLIGTNVLVNYMAFAGTVGADYALFSPFVLNMANAFADVGAIRDNNLGGLGVMNFDATYARKIGMVSIGIELGLGYTDNKVNNGDDVNYKFYEPRVKIGATIPVSAALWIEAAVWASFPMIDAMNKDTFEYGTDGVAYDITLWTRVNYRVAKQHHLHMWFDYTASSYDTKYEDKRAGADNSMSYDRGKHVIHLGFSDEMNFTATSLAFVGFDFLFTANDANIYKYVDSGAAEVEVEGQPSTDIVAKIRMGGEATIWKTLQFRMGLTHSFLVYHEMGNASNNGTRTLDYAGFTGNFNQLNYQTTVAIGMAAKLGDLIFEFNLEKALFTEGPYFLTGEGAANAGNSNLAANVTCIYLLPLGKESQEPTNEEK